MPLPEADIYGAYKLTGGSKIYPSNQTGKWFIWVFESFEKDKVIDLEGNETEVNVPKGSIMMNKDSLMYFDTPELAMEKLGV